MRRSKVLALVICVSLAVFAGGARGQGGGDSERQGVGLLSAQTVSVRVAERDDIERLTDAGVIVTNGAKEVVVSLFGEMKGKTSDGGNIGLVLIPDLPFFQKAMRERKVILNTGEVVASVAAGESGLFLSASKELRVGFPRYHLYLYNATGAAADVTVAVYATN